jgi:hypothetical protein
MFPAVPAWILSPSLVLLAVFLRSAGAPAAEGRPDPRISELKVLDQFAGAWTGTQPGTRRKASSNSQWILDGRVLQTNSTLTDGREMLVLRTYDPALRKYVVTIWDSRGMAVILSGDWDPEQKTLTATADAGRSRIRAVWKLIDEDTEQWQIVFADLNGKPLRQLSGTNRRDPAEP